MLAMEPFKMMEPPSFLSKVGPLSRPVMHLGAFRCVSLEIASEPVFMRMCWFYSRWRPNGIRTGVTAVKVPVMPQVKIGTRKVYGEPRRRFSKRPGTMVRVSGLVVAIPALALSPPSQRSSCARFPRVAELNGLLGYSSPKSSFSDGRVLIDS